MTVQLDQLGVGEAATVVFLQNQGAIRRRLRDIGLIEGTVVKCIGRSPCGDPSAYWIRGAVFAIRAADASRIGVEKRSSEEAEKWA